MVSWSLSLLIPHLFAEGVKTFAKQTVFDAHLSGKKHIKAAELLSSKAVDPVTHEKLKQRRDDEREKPVAWLEAKISKLAELLGAERSAVSFPMGESHADLFHS